MPGTLDRYFAAQNAHDVDAMAACFTDEATVRDEGRLHAGRGAIRGWMTEVNARYAPTVEPLGRREDSGTAEVVVRVAGTFPGSPIELTYRFAFAPDGLIRSLEIG